MQLFGCTAVGGGSTSVIETSRETTPTAPAVETGTASSVTGSSAALSAFVNPDGAEVECKLEYGTSTSYGSSAPCTPPPGSGESTVTVSAALSGLAPNTTYHFRVSATNSLGTSDGSDASFTTPDAPAVETRAATSITQTSATLNATVNPDGGEVSGCTLEYGATAAYGSSAPCTPSPGSGESPVAVSAAITRLAANTTYHFRISATNPSGTSKGPDQVLKTLPNPPAVVTGTASAVMQSSATLSASVNPHGGEVSECKFEYGTTTAYGSSAPCTPSPGSGESPVAVSASITGLSANTTYHFRVSATNPGGTSSGSDQTFGPPVVVTGTASPVLETSATLKATVNPSGGEVSECKFEYGTTTAYGSSAPCAASPGSGSSPVEVSVSATSLAANTTYHFRISATNPSGARSGSDQTFVTLPLSGPTFATSFTPEKSEGSFKEPDAVAVDPSGNIWVADSGHDRVLEFNAERKYLRQFSTAGTGEGQYEGIAGKGIAGIAANSTGDIYVTGSDRVQEFSPTGEFLRQWGSPGSGNGQFLYPDGIAVDSSGNVWVLDTFNYRVQEFSESGAYLGQFGSKGTENGQLGWASGLAFSGGNLYVADSSRVEEFSTAGAYLAQFGSSGTNTGQFHGLGGIATDPTTGNLYVSDTYNNRVQEFSAAGAVLAAFGSGGSGAGQFSAPRGLAVNSSGSLYVADTGNNRVQEWVPSP